MNFNIQCMCTIYWWHVQSSILHSDVGHDISSLGQIGKTDKMILYDIMMTSCDIKWHSMNSKNGLRLVAILSISEIYINTIFIKLLILI